MKVCVVGAGVSGLTAIKHLLEYGLDVVCYEAGQYIAGLWRYNPGDRDGKSPLFEGTSDRIRIGHEEYDTQHEQRVHHLFGLPTGREDGQLPP